MFAHYFMPNLKDKPLPPCPDPRCYILVQTKEGSYWRMKRGLNKPAKLNENLQASANRMKVTSPAAKRIITALRHQLADLETGRITVRIGSLLGRSLKEDGKMDYRYMTGYDFQPYYPMNDLVRVNVKFEKTEQSLRVHIPMDPAAPVLKEMKDGITGFKFAVTIVKGDPSAEARSTSMTSAIYPAEIKEPTTCTLSVMLPPAGTPWILCLKVTCMAGGDVAASYGDKGMQVIAVSNG